MIAVQRASNSAAVVGVGARTHAGLDALQTTLAVRARKMRVRESHMIDRHGEKVGTCRLASISDAIQGLPRFVALASPPLVQATFAWRSDHRARNVNAPPLAVVVALPSTMRPGFDPRLRKELLPQLQAQSGIALDARLSTVVCQDRGGGVLAFVRAMELLASGACDVVAVGGVDSWFDPEAIEHLDAAFRLHALETENGIIPGEGAAFVLLAAKARSLTKLGTILGAAVADEPRPYGSEEPCQGVGMTRAIREATGGLYGEERILWALTDVANERHRVDEWQLAFGRAGPAFEHHVRHDQPLLKTGDVGAASAATMVAIACVTFDIGGAPGDLALVAAHSDGSERGALVLAAPEAKERAS